MPPPVSLEISLVADKRHGSIVATESLVFTDDVQVSGSLVEAGSTHDGVDDDECAGPLEITLRLLVSLYASCIITEVTQSTVML